MQHPSSIFNLDHSEEMKLEDLHLIDKEKLNNQPQIQNVYVGTLQEIKKPFLQQIKPYLQSILTGAASTAGHAATYGQKAISALGGALWWGYNGLIGLFSKTAEYIQPKFVLITSKLQIKGKQNMDAINKISKDVAVVGLEQIKQIKQLQSIQNGKFQVTVPMDQDFINYLKNQKLDLKQKEWEPNLEPTKTMIIPSAQFSEIFQQLKQNKVAMKANNYGGFCTFDLQGDSQVQYECLNKLKLGKQYVQGYLMPLGSRVQSVKSMKSNSSSEGLDGEAPIRIDSGGDAQVESIKSVQAVELMRQYQSSEQKRQLFTE